MARTRDLVVGIDLGGTNFAVGIVDNRGRVLGRSKKKTKAREGRDAVLARIVEAVGAACADAGVAQKSLRAAGIGAPSAIDIPRGLVINSGNLRWKNEPLRELLARRLHIPVAVDNDVNVALWGEHRHGAAKARQHALGVWVGTGVGGALLLNGQLWHGPTWTAGEIGQTVLFPGAPHGHRTLEELCSRNGIVSSMRARAGFHPASRFHELLDEEQRGEAIGSGAIAKLWRDGDSLVRESIDAAAELLGVAIANQVTMLSVDCVVLGGGVSEALGAPFVKQVRASFQRHVFPDTLRNCDIVLSERGGDAGVVGAAALARERV